MSVPPTAVIVYAGVWNATTEYFQYYGVVSPIDGKFYVYVGDVPITGGNDPSDQLDPLWVLIQNGGGGGSGVASLQTLTGVVSLGSPSDTISINTAGQAINLDVQAIPLAVAVTSLNNYQDAVNLTSPLGTITINPVSQNIELEAVQIPIAFGTALILGDPTSTVFYIPTGAVAGTYTIDAPVSCVLSIPDGTTNNQIVYSRSFSGATLQYIEVGFTQPVTNGGLILVSWSVLATDSIPVEATTVPV